jgi:hypothetical protein
VRHFIASLGGTDVQELSRATSTSIGAD